MSRPELWGVLNVTPDSFSDGGRFLDPDLAIARGLALHRDGARVIDVGAESTRPGAARFPVDEEIRRLSPVVAALRAEGLSISVDTMNAATAEAMCALGVDIINDVSGGLADEAMFRVIASSDVDYVAMHWRGHSNQMDQHTDYEDVVRDVRDHLVERVSALSAAGVPVERVWIDPGFGFSKTVEQNWQIASRLDEVVGWGPRVLVGASRKRFLAALLPEDHTTADRDEVSAQVTMVFADAGVDAIRVHEPARHQRALDVWESARRGELRRRSDG